MSETKPKAEIVPVSVNERGVQLATMDDMFRLANAFHKSKMFERSHKSPESIMVAIQAGVERGFSITESLGTITVINGRVSIMGDGARAMIRAAGVLEPGTDIEWEVAGEGDNRVGRARSHRKGMKTVYDWEEFSVADAKLARLWGKSGPWSEYPGRMLKYRALGFHLRDQYSDVLKGLTIAEEARDITRHVTVGRGATLPESTTTDPLLIEAGVVDAVVPEPEAIEPDEVKPALSTACDHSEVEAGRCCVCGELVKPELE
ncbi:MAG: hypothetical protein GY733_03970, partial [bacterium]|nr:hypothetical protein [bacterium]